MTDFSRNHRGMAYFGIGHEETADAYGARDAIAILAQAVDRTQDVDLLHDGDTLDALSYLDEIAGNGKRVAAFRKALAVPHPVTRRRAVADAYRAMCKAAEAYSGGRH